MNANRALFVVGIAILVALPFVTSTYVLHLLIQILIWAFIYTAWSLMGRFGFVSFGHGAFMGLGAYIPALMWTYWGLTPWLGIPLAVAAAVLLAVIVGYPCFARRVVGHYFALVTLALSRCAAVAGRGARDHRRQRRERRGRPQMVVEHSNVDLVEQLFRFADSACRVSEITVLAQDGGSKEQVLWIIVKEQYANGIFDQVQNLPSRRPARDFAGSKTEI